MYYYYDSDNNYVGCGNESVFGDYEVRTTPPAPAPKTNDEIIAELTAALEAHYDATAHERRYDNRITCALRAGYAGPFQAEGQTFAIWMDTCNALAYQIMAECLAGTRTIPAPAEIVALMPDIVWQ